MSAGHDHREPLDGDERELAGRLARIGPFDGPSPALDARILAAAHAAATRKPARRPWLAWIGIPPTMITGVGVAAAAVLALGLVWRLPPRPVVLPPGDEASAPGEEVFVMAEPAPSSRAPVANPPPFPQEARRSAPEPSPPAAAPSVRLRAPAVAREAAGGAPVAEKALATPAAPEPVPTATAVPAEKPEPARAPAAFAEDKSSTGEDAFVPSPPAATTTRRAARASYTTGARADAERDEPARMAVDAQSGATSEAPAAPQESADLDRIQVTGTRRPGAQALAELPLSEIPVSADTRLDAGDWLQRIRDRREQGDIEGARDSLRRFRREHPRIRVPDDLRPLLANTPR